MGKIFTSQVRLDCNGWNEMPLIAGVIGCTNQE